MTTYRRPDDDDDEPVPASEFMSRARAEADPTVDDQEIPLGAAIDYAERQRGELDHG
jgi:hypothetical protein